MTGQGGSRPRAVVSSQATKHGISTNNQMDVGIRGLESCSGFARTESLVARTLRTAPRSDGDWSRRLPPRVQSSQRLGQKRQFQRGAACGAYELSVATTRSGGTRRREMASRRNDDFGIGIVNGDNNLIEAEYGDWQHQRDRRVSCGDQHESAATWSSGTRRFSSPSVCPEPRASISGISRPGTTTFDRNVCVRRQRAVSGPFVERGAENQINDEQRPGHGRGRFVWRCLWRCCSHRRFTRRVRSRRRRRRGVAGPRRPQ